MWPGVVWHGSSVGGGAPRVDMQRILVISESEEFRRALAAIWTGPPHSTLVKTCSVEGAVRLMAEQDFDIVVVQPADLMSGVFVLGEAAARELLQAGADARAADAVA